MRISNNSASKHNYGRVVLIINSRGEKGHIMKKIILITTLLSLTIAPLHAQEESVLSRRNVIKNLALSVGATGLTIAAIVGFFKPDSISFFDAYKRILMHPFCHKVFAPLYTCCYFGIFSLYQSRQLDKRKREQIRQEIEQLEQEQEQRKRRIEQLEQEQEQRKRRIEENTRRIEQLEQQQVRILHRIQFSPVLHAIPREIQRRENQRRIQEQQRYQRQQVQSCMYRKKITHDLPIKPPRTRI